MSQISPVKIEAAHVLRKFPIIGSTCLLLQHKRREGLIAATDGKTVWFGKKYFEFKSSERQGVLLHEYLHVALAHPARGGLVRNREGNNYSPEGFNIAADAIINDTIRKYTGYSESISLPEGGVVFSKLLKDIIQILGDNELRKINSSNISVEKLYRILMQAKSKAQNILEQKTTSQKSEKATQDKSSSVSNEANKKAQELSSQRLIDMFSEEPDLQAQNGSFEELNEEIRNQSQRIANSRSTYGNTGADIFEKLRGDLPVSKISWKKQFRSVTAKYLGKERKKNYNRPSGSMISRHAMGQKFIWEPGRKRSPQPKVLVIGDSSGSITMKDYLKFLGETEAMKRRTGAKIDFASADTKIREITSVETIKSIRKINFKGRGGTSFIQPLQYAEKENYNLVIYLTDMDGAFPDKCKVPVIWAVTNEINAAKKHPFGRMLCLS